MIQFDDILPLDVYGRARADFRRALSYHRRQRRLALGPDMSLLFESRMTVLAQIQEVLWIEGRRSRAEIEREIDEYGCLVPSPTSLTATLTIHAGSREFGEVLSRELVRDREPAVMIESGDLCHGCRPLRPDDVIPAAVHYLGFDVLSWTARVLERAQPVQVRLRSAMDTRVVPMPTALRVALAETLTGASRRGAWRPDAAPARG